MEIFKLFGRILIEDNAAQDSLAKVDDKAKGTGNSLASMIGTAAKVGTAVVAGASVAAGGLFALANKVSESTSAINDMAVRTGLSTDRLQELQYAAGQVGVNFETVQNAAMKMQKNMGAASDTTKGVGLAFSQLGVSTRDANGNLLSSQAVFDQTLQKLAGMTNETQRNALGMKIFGGSFTEIQPLVAGGTDGLAKMSDEAHKLGLVLSGDAIAAGDQFGDTLDKLQQMFGGLVSKIGVELMPMFQSLMDWVSSHMPEIQKVIGFSVDAVSISIQILAEVIGTTINAIKSLTDFFIKHWAIVQPILIGIGAGAATFGLYTLAINAAAIATTIWTTVTTIATVAGTAFGAVIAFLTSPIGLVVVAIGLLVAAGVLLYKNWDTVKEYASKTWDSIKNSISSVGEKIGNVWESLKDSTTSAWNAIKNAVKMPVNAIIGYVNGVINAYENMINLVSKAINAIPDVKIPDWVPLVGGKSFGIPKIPTINFPSIPMLAEGGNITKGGATIVGEAGAELLNLPTGSRVTPLDKVSSGVTFERGAFEGAFIMDDYGVDRLMERIMQRMRVLGVN